MIIFSVYLRQAQLLLYMATKTNQPKQEKNEDFGLPQGEFKPIESVGGRWLKITAIILGLVLSVGTGIVYWFFCHTPSHLDNLSKTAHSTHGELESKSTGIEHNAKFIDKEMPSAHPSTTKDEQHTKLYQELEELKDDKQAKSFNAKHAVKLTKEGTITRINTPQGYYYTVVGSFIDDDLALDYAKQLAKKGVNVTLIVPPKGKYFYRVAIEQKANLREAHVKTASLKSEYGTDIW